MTNGALDSEKVWSRGIVVKDGSIRKPVVTETLEFENDSWAGLLCDLVDAFNEDGGGEGGGSEVTPAAIVMGAITSDKVGTWERDPSDWKKVAADGTYLIADTLAATLFEAPEDGAGIKYVNPDDSSEQSVLVTAHVTVKASVTPVTTIEASLGFATGDADLDQWSQKAEGSSGFVHLTCSMILAMNTTTRSTVYLLMRGNAYDSTLDITRVQVSAIKLGPTGG